MTASPEQRSLLFGTIKLAPAVTASQVWIFVAILLCSVCVLPFVSLMQPLLLTELLAIPADRQGTVTGFLSTAHQAAFLACIGVAGALADRIGRRWMLIIGMSGFAACMWFYPLVTTMAALFVARIGWGISESALSVGRVARFMDYPANESRGKFISLMMLLQAGVGALFVAGLSSRLPGWLRSQGISGGEAVGYAFLLMSLIAVIGALLAVFFLNKDGRPAPAPTPRPAGRRARGAMFTDLRTVWAVARTNPRLAVVLLIGSVIRTDSVVFTTFIGLWVIHSARAQGIDAIEAVKTTGALMLVSGVSGSIAPPIFGWLADRMDRLTLLLGAMVVTGIAFCSFFLVSDIFSPWVYLIIILVGLAEAAQSVSANALLGEEAPENLRGTICGLFTFLGTATAMAIGLLAGFLFDRMGPAAPFVLEGLLCFGFCLAALALMARQRSQAYRAPA